MNKAIKLPAEVVYKKELAYLASVDKHHKPPGWKLSGRAVRSFVLGDGDKVSKKFYGDDALVERCIVTLMGNQGLLLVGEPGTAKSLLSELLAAAISGDSQKIIQGTAGTTEDHIKFSWNYALLLSKGPSEASIIPTAIFQAMQSGSIARFEEMTRCPQEIQDAMISLMSEKQIVIPELNKIQDAIPGFNLIATANLHDKGVNEMSSALKRRFNFETVNPIRDVDLEKQIIRDQVTKKLRESDIDIEINEDVLNVLVTAFDELREQNQFASQSLSAVLSTAEAVNIAFACCLQGYYMDEKLTSAHIAQQMQGVIIKDQSDDRKKLAHYLDVVVREKAKRDENWLGFFNAGKTLWMS